MIDMKRHNLYQYQDTTEIHVDVEVVDLGPGWTFVCSTPAGMTDLEAFAWGHWYIAGPKRAAKERGLWRRAVRFAGRTIQRLADRLIRAGEESR